MAASFDPSASSGLRAPSQGIPAGARQTPIPSAFFGQLLSEIDDLAELKATLRLYWYLQSRKGTPRYATLEEMAGARAFWEGIVAPGEDVVQAVKAALDKAVARGSVLRATVESHGASRQVFTLNTEPDRRALERLDGANLPAETTGEVHDHAMQRPSIYRLYEENIGLLNPVVAEEMKEAEGLYPLSWIEEAIKEAARFNKKSWRYIQRILETWAREGPSTPRQAQDSGRGEEVGEAGRHPQKVARGEYLRRYGPTAYRGPLGKKLRRG